MLAEGLEPGTFWFGAYDADRRFAKRRLQRKHCKYRCFFLEPAAPAVALQYNTYSVQASPTQWL